MFNFIDYNKPQLDLPAVLKELDKVLGSVALPREQHLAFHIALQQVIAKLESPESKVA